MSAIFDEHTQFVDSGGIPLVGGFIYIGDQGADPVLNPKAIFSDRALSSALANPQTLDSLGRSTNKIWTDGSYSIRITDSDLTQIYQELDNGEETGTVTLALGNVLGSNAITADGSPTITALNDNAQFLFEITSENTTDAVTLNIDGLGAKAIKRSFDLDVGIGRFKVGQKVKVIYNSGNDNFELANDNRSVILGNKSADIASATTTDLATATGNQVDITGTTTITGLGTVIAGVIFHLTFDGALTFTHNDTSLILPNDGENITTQAGDTCIAESLGSGNWKVSNYQRAVGIPYPKGYIDSGFDLITNATDPTNDVDIDVGACRDQDDTYNIILATALTKQIDAAWTEGDDAGGYASASAIADGTWYHIHVVKNISTGVVDVCFDASVTAAQFHTTNSGYVSRRIGSVLREATATNRPFASINGEVIFGSRDRVLTGNMSTSGTSLTVTTPLGVVTIARITFLVRRTLVGTAFGLLTPLSATNVAASSSASNLAVEAEATVGRNCNDVSIMTDTSSAIQQRADTNASTVWDIDVTGYYDFRGI